VHSLHKNFSERFRGSINKITELAATVRYLAQLGSQAEVRVVRLEVEGLQDELQDIRVGMSGRFRQLAEYLHAQHGENMKQHEKTQELLANYQSVGMLPAPPVAELDYQRLIQSTERLALPETEPVPAAVAAAANDYESASTGEATSDQFQETPLSNQMWRLFDSMASEVGDKRNNHPNLFDRPLAQAVNTWLSKSASSILYLEYLASVSNEDTILALADQIIDCCKSAGHCVLPRDLQCALVVRSRFEDPYRRLVAVLLYLAYAAMSHDRERQSNFGPTLINRPEDMSIREAATILSNAIRCLPAGRFHIVIPGHIFFANISAPDLQRCLCTLRQVTEDLGEVLGSRLKVIILTPLRITELLSCLEPHELALLRQQPGKSKVPKISIVVPPT
jgi:molybdopterin converting factor small subunit